MSKTITTKTATAQRNRAEPNLVRIKLGSAYRDLTKQQALHLAQRIAKTLTEDNQCSKPAQPVANSQRPPTAQPTNPAKTTATRTDVTPATTKHGTNSPDEHDASNRSAPAAEQPQTSPQTTPPKPGPGRVKAYPYDSRMS